MRNISLKTDGVGDTLPAADFNANLRTELQSIVTDCGFTLDPEGGPNTDLNMLGKSIAIYSNASQYYSDTGSANTYEVNRVGNLQPLEQLVDGVIIFFKAANSNNGGSTLDVDGMGAKDLVNNSGLGLIGGEILSGQYVQARYNSATDNFEVIFSNSLLTWRNQGNDLLPAVSGTGNIGSPTFMAGGFYLADNAKLFLGDGQDFEIYHDSTNSNIINQTGNLIFNNRPAGQLIFQTQDVTRWLISSSGHLIPGSAGTLNIGSTAAEVGNIYQGDNCYHYFGDDQDLGIYFDGTDSNIIANSGNITMSAIGANFLYFWTNSTLRWSINTAGHLIPGAANTYSLGNTSTELKNIYQSTQGYHYFGDGQEAYIYFGTHSPYSSDYTFFSSPNNSFVFETDQSLIVAKTDGSYLWFINSSSHLIPGAGGVSDIGTSTQRVRTIYSTNVLNVSDTKFKKDIKPLDIGLDFIKRLDPISFKLSEINDDKTRFGFKAQDVDKILKSIGSQYNSLSAIHYDEQNDRWDIDYNQFIGPIIKSIKDLDDKIESIINSL